MTIRRLLGCHTRSITVVSVQDRSPPHPNPYQALLSLCRGVARNSTSVVYFVLKRESSYLTHAYNAGGVISDLN
jgi:hypothetical protein